MDAFVHGQLLRSFSRGSIPLSVRAGFAVLAAALMARMMPLAIGLLVATLFTSADYADTVVLLTAANLCGALPMLAVTPQVIRSESSGMAMWLASRGLVVGIPIIALSAWATVQYLREPGSGFFVSAYASALFVLGVAQSLHNQRMENSRALLHAGAVTTLAVFGGLLGYLGDGTVSGFVHSLAGTMLVAALISYSSIWLRRDRLASSLSKPHLATGVGDAIWSGFFGLLVVAGLFIAGARVKHAGDEAAYVAFTLGLQVFSVVIFIPGALSAYLVPRLVRSGAAGARDALTATVRTYALIGVVALLSAMLVAPVLFQYLQQPAEPRQWWIFALIQVAAVLAAINAAFTQTLVSMGRFRALAMLSLAWLVVLLGFLVVARLDGVWIAAALAIDYAVLVSASGTVCRRALSAGIAVQ